MEEYIVFRGKKYKAIKEVYGQEKATSYAKRYRSEGLLIKLIPKSYIIYGRVKPNIGIKHKKWLQDKYDL